jgi:hypothetical protein
MEGGQGSPDLHLLPMNEMVGSAGRGSGGRMARDLLDKDHSHAKC